MKKTVILLSILFISYAFAARAASAPEIFVQTGHSSGVNFVAVNRSGSYLVTMEASPSHGKFAKTWDIATGREIRTIKLEAEYSVSNIQFMDDGRFIVFYQKVAEIFDVYGQKVGSLALPKVIHVSGPSISKNGKLFFNQGFGTKIYNVKDGSEITLPEFSKYEDYQRYHQAVADLAYGYYGVFHKGGSRNGNVDYVIYDDGLNVRLRGTLNIPGISSASKFKVSPDLKYVAYQPINNSDDVSVYNLKTGELLFRYRPRPLAKSGTTALADESFFFGFSPDGRLRVEYDKQKQDKSSLSARVEMALLSPLKNGAYSEKTLPAIDMVTWIAYEYQCSPYVMTEKGMFAGLSNGNVILMDMKTGGELKSFGVKPAVFRQSYALGNRIFNWQSDWSVTDKKIGMAFNLWELGDPAPLKKVNVRTETGLYEKPIMIGNHRSRSWFSSDPDSLYRHVPADFWVDHYRDKDGYGSIAGLFGFLKSSGDLDVVSEQYKLVVKSRTTKKRLVDLYAFEDGEWIIMTPDGYYSASANGDRYLSVRKDNNIYSIENYREAFFRPDLVKVAIAGNTLAGYKTMADVGRPPLVKIENMPDNINADSVTFTLRIMDTGGGIGDIRLYLNDTSVMTDNARAVAIKGTEHEKEKVKKYTLHLLNGVNTIKAIAFDKDNNVQSNPAVKKITASFKSIKKPALYALVIGINDYKNPKLKLKYAEADAKLFADVLQETAGRMFDKVNITRLTSRDSASKANILKELEKFKRLNPDDVFAFYVASHGTVDDGEYYLITSNVGALSTDRLKKDAVTQKELRELIANVPAAKKLIIIDTCNAGKLGEQIQMAMLTRGMSEDTAMKILSRAVGSTIISASTSLQEALEGYKDHGLFTYVLTEGMRGKADVSHSGYVKTSDLASYVEETVPDVAERVFKRAQYPTKAINGNDFPIGRIKQAR